jgi:hypothetical protein
MALFESELGQRRAKLPFAHTPGFAEMVERVI